VTHQNVDGWAILLWKCGIKFNPLTRDAHCCHMGTAIKHPVPDRVKPSFLTPGHSDAQGWASDCPDVKNYK